MRNKYVIIFFFLSFASHEKQTEWFCQYTWLLNHESFCSGSLHQTVTAAQNASTSCVEYNFLDSLQDVWRSEISPHGHLIPV
jgi:hypothetical protein